MQALSCATNKKRKRGTTLWHRKRGSGEGRKREVGGGLREQGINTVFAVGKIQKFVILLSFSCLSIRLNFDNFAVAVVFVLDF